jgi:hypothetical protein
MESVRGELKRYKAGVQGEVADLKAMLVAAQTELGGLKGHSSTREAMVTDAQKKVCRTLRVPTFSPWPQLKSLKPWVGIEIITGPKNVRARSAFFSTHLLCFR